MTIRYLNLQFDKNQILPLFIKLPGVSKILQLAQFFSMDMVKCIAITLLLSNLSACSSLGVEPWQRDILSQPDMQFGSTNLTSTLSQHFYFSKEASSGGKGFAGGGCGCN